MSRGTISKGHRSRLAPNLKSRRSLLSYLKHVRDLGEAELYLDNARLLEGFAEGRTALSGDPGSVEARLREIAERIAACAACELYRRRRQAVPGDGNPLSGLVLIGEAPGEQEDREGKPFVGPSGKLLRRLLAAAGLSEERYFIANVLKCRPPGNRDPLPDEVSACTPFLAEQLAVLSPKLLVALGRYAGRHLLGLEGASLRSMRGKIHIRDEVPLVVTYHPSALLHRPECRRDAWLDIKRIARLYAEYSPHTAEVN
jgi:uracil-DNA glycosylase family 4